MNKIYASFFLLMLLMPITTQASDIWNFKVYLDDKPVGHHRFTLSGQLPERQLHSEARFDVKLLMFTAYTYVHEASESWQGNCLVGLQSKTDENGELTQVSGGREAGKFRLQANQAQTELPDCVMSFAYWNPSIIAQKYLLNPQTGEYVPVRVYLKGDDKIKVSGLERSAKRYRLDAGKLQIDLWYGTDDHRWLALETNLDGGRRLSYRIE